MRLTIQAGTTTTYKNGSEITKNIYCQNVDELMEEFEKQKSEFKNPNVTEDEIMNFTEGVQDSKRIQKLGQYEDIDESPEHLADIKKALEIIKEKQVNVRRAIILRETYEDYLENYGELFAHCESILTQEEYDLLKEVL